MTIYKFVNELIERTEKEGSYEQLWYPLVGIPYSTTKSYETIGKNGIKVRLHKVIPDKRLGDKPVRYILEFIDKEGKESLGQVFEEDLKIEGSLKYLYEDLLVNNKTF